MARTHNRYRRSTEEAVSAAALPPKSDAPGGEGWRRIWVPWAVGGGLLLVGALVGWLAPLLVFRPVFRESAVRSHTPRPKDPAALVQGAMPALDAAPGEQVELVWLVLNTGDGPWGAGEYSFLPTPESAGAPVVSLPSDIKTGSTSVIRVLATVPAEPGTWQPAWDLRGPLGPVPGGRLTATVRILADRALPGPPYVAPPLAPTPPGNPGQPAVLPPMPETPPPPPVSQPDPQPDPQPQPQPDPVPDPAPQP